MSSRMIKRLDEWQAEERHLEFLEQRDKYRDVMGLAFDIWMDSCPLNEMELEAQMGRRGFYK